MCFFFFRFHVHQTLNKQNWTNKLFAALMETHSRAKQQKYKAKCEQNSTIFIFLYILLDRFINESSVTRFYTVMQNYLTPSGTLLPVVPQKSTYSCVFKVDKKLHKSVKMEFAMSISSKVSNKYIVELILPSRSQLSGKTNLYIKLSMWWT